MHQYAAVESTIVLHFKGAELSQSGLRKLGKPGCVAFSRVDKTAAKLPRFGEELNSIARGFVGITCGAIRPACGAALGRRLVHLNAETVNEFRHHAIAFAQQA